MLSSQYELKKMREARKSLKSNKSKHAPPIWKDSDIPAIQSEKMYGFLGLEELDGSLYNPVQQSSPTSKLISSIEPQYVSEAGVFHDFAADEDQEPSRVLPKKRKAGKPIEKARRQRSKTTTQPSTQASITNQNDAISDAGLTSPGPSAILSQEVVKGWDNIPLSLPLLRALSTIGFLKPTEIQLRAIPRILAGHDLIGKAVTGSGKTLAFAIPILEAFLSRSGEMTSMTALILVPTRELAKQIVDHISAIAQFCDTGIVSISGGLSIEKQRRQLKRIPDIIVATPGRLWDLMSDTEIVEALSRVKFLVLDEADRLLQSGHFQELSRILECLGSGRDRQTLVFSATFDQDLQHKLKKNTTKLIENGQTNEVANDESLDYLLQQLQFGSSPCFIDASPDVAVSRTIQQCLIQTASMDKDYVLYYMLIRYSSKTLIFTNSISDVYRIVELLGRLGLIVSGLHSSKQQKSRLRAIERFKQVDNAVLVATDVAARGLDIANVDMIIHYHLPRTTDMYIHRSGRTARADAQGISILICSPSELPLLRRMLKNLESPQIHEFPLNLSDIGSLKPRVNTARRLISLEADLRKKETIKDSSWLAEATRDLGVETVREDDNGDVAKRHEVRALKSRLQQEPVVTKVSGTPYNKFLTRGGADLAMQMLAGQNHPLFVNSSKCLALESLRDKNLFMN